MEALKSLALVARLKLVFSGVVAPTKTQLQSGDFTPIIPKSFPCQGIHTTWAESEDDTRGMPTTLPVVISRMPVVLEAIYPYSSTLQSSQ